jgi:hypothetical protein
MAIESVLVTERLLLRFLCTGGSGTPLREELISQLRGYAFRSVEHQVLFDCLQTMPLDRPEVVRELLPARLVRAGFPDFDWGPFFEARESSGVSEEEARRLCRELKRGVGSRERGENGQEQTHGIPEAGTAATS